MTTHDLWDGSDGDSRAYDPPLTPAERRDLADFMIERWQRWAGLDATGTRYRGVPLSRDATDAAHTRYRGVPLIALSKDELIILAEGLIRQLETERARHRADLDALL